MKTYLVGGAVRDKLLGMQPKDLDWVVVGATASNIACMLEQGFAQVGADFPVFLHPVTGEEYALARVERKTGVGYHGFSVQADQHVTIEEDLGRRDLTINSMAMDDSGVVVDPYGGLQDLHNHVLRHTTEAFAEDPLRVLRLARFAARFPAWSIADETMDLCKRMCQAGDLKHLTTERVWVELTKGFGEIDPHRFLQVLSETGALVGNPILNQLFGDEINPQQKHLAIAIGELVPSDKRLVISIGLLSRINSALPGATTRAKDCHANFKSLVEVKPTAESLLALLVKSKAFQEGDQFGDLVLAALTTRIAGFHLIFSSSQLITAKRIAMDVKASQFPHLEGKELGLAIRAERINRLNLGLSIPDLSYPT